MSGFANASAHVTCSTNAEGKCLILAVNLRAETIGSPSRVIHEGVLRATKNGSVGEGPS